MSDEELNSVGWDAIDQAMEKVYGDQEPKHYGTMISYMLGGNDPLDGISVYEAKEPMEHWHFVTYGFSELHEKESENLEVSGYGFELTFRLAKKHNETEPPSWALNFLQNLARYVFNSGNVFKNGDYMDANGPICLESDTELTALAFAYDPELPKMDTPNGTVEFIQVVGITADELEAMQIWNTLGVLHICTEYMPQLITDLLRTSCLHNDKVVEAIETGSETEGSNTGFLFNDQITWTPGGKKFFKRIPAMMTIGAKQAVIIGKVLKGRQVKEEPLRLVSNEVTVVFSFSDQPQLIEDSLEIQLNKKAVEELIEQLQPIEKEFSIPSLENIAFKIVKTEVKDSEGKIVETIG
ncbi:suppressor of fused domain protein [Pseudogracilibacillus auburnensis]|uniref:Suppressor of fused protein SUFU n=1 Tax=Pseudogracilibacillus auburnensis TaxID=1494959 RepID=A0A2V3WF91_9BACI|nr:suppressor of fused domain protein [Pseudogracilibacillus auburnensis]PXW87519.1 suppressor of fused protein SUFU [Pseudogracilibacillus auburnensis]